MQKLTRTLAMASALAFAGVLAGCGDDVTVADPTTVTVTPASANLKVGESVTLTAAVATTNANKGVTWTSSGANATVDANGKVTAVAAGNATITATAAADAGAKASALITISADKGVQAVAVSPNNAIIKVGEFIQATANVTRNPGVAGTVTWSSSATAIATVDNTGKITAVTNGSAVITAASTVDPTVTGSMALTVRPLQPAQISIQKVTVAGNTNAPVNFNNVVGQIDVTLNLDPGDQTVTKVEVLVDAVVACSQNLSVAESEQLSLAAAFPENVEAVDVVCSINTAEFNTATGAVKYANGAHNLTARATIGGTTPGNVATPSQALTFNNQSGFIAAVANTNTNTGFPNSAINPTTGQNWVQGNVTLTLTAVNYTAGGATVSAISGSFLTGGTQPVPAAHVFTQVAPAAGTQVFTIAYPNSGTTALNTVGYQSPAGGELPVITGSVLSNGQAGPTDILNIAFAPGNGMTPLPGTRLDNAPPAAATVNTNFPVWVNAAFTFTPTAIYTAGADAGVNAVKTDFYTIGGGAALPATACSVTGMTKVTKGSDLAETIVSDYRPRAVSYDALGNATCADMSVAGGTPFGADFTPPNNVTFAGVADQATFNVIATAQGTNYVLASTGDNASGISATTPGLVSIVRVNSTGANTCVIGGTPTTACPQIAQAGTASITGGAAVEGYYTITAQMTDNAANVAPATAFTRTFLVDASAPTFTGNIGLAALYTGNAPAAFTGLSISDNLDLSKLFGVVQYTGAAVNVQYADQSLGAFGTPLEKAFSGTYTIPSLIRCVNPANTFAANNANKAQNIILVAQDVAGNQQTNTPVPGALAAAVESCGAVGNLTAPAVINTFNQSAPTLPAGKTQVDIDGANLVAASATSVGLTAVADVSLDNSPEPFTRVEFYYTNGLGNLVKIGQAGAGVLNQTVTNRTWTYSFTWDPDATIPVGAVTITVVAIDAQGDAVITGTQVVNTVQ